MGKGGALIRIHHKLNIRTSFIRTSTILHGKLMSYRDSASVADLHVCCQYNILANRHFGGLLTLARLW